MKKLKNHKTPSCSQNARKVAKKPKEISSNKSPLQPIKPGHQFQFTKAIHWLATKVNVDFKDDYWSEAHLAHIEYKGNMKEIYKHCNRFRMAEYRHQLRNQLTDDFDKYDQNKLY